MTAVWQQIFALDARYNANRAPTHPNFRTLYIRRRNQLLKETFQGREEPPERKQYLKTRAFLLQQRYGPPGSSFDQSSLRSRSVRSYSRISDTSDYIPKSRSVTESLGGSVVPTKEADASRAIVGGTTIAENYAFVGVHHIFDQHRSAVTLVKFANNDRSRLCCASKDGCVSICNVTNTPPTVDLILREHTKAVTGCDWSVDNDLVVSGSMDGTLRLWDSNTGNCLRVVCDSCNAEVLSCMFQPANNNVVISGNSKGVVSLLNISAGIYPKGGASKMGGAILSLTCDSTGGVVWAGNDRGAITSFSVAAWKLTKQRKIVVSPEHPVTCLSWRSWVSREARNPSLLVNCAADVVCLFRVIDKEGGLSLKKKFSIRHRSELVRSTFCPIMSFRQGACVVTGSEDSCVYFLDIERDQRPVVNKLQGHSCPVLAVSFNYDESLLATSDLQGLIIIWKRDAKAYV